MTDPSSVTYVLTRAESVGRPVLEALRSIRLLILSIGSCVASCAPASTLVTPSDGGSRPEDAWLASIGSGEAQNRRVCSRGATDAVAQALCAPSSPQIRGLGELYRALDLADPNRRYVAATTHSLGLSARFVTALNPRTFVFVPERNPIPYRRFAVVAFARGEQLVELVGIDERTLDYNFYLLRFEQECNRTRCTPADLLTEAVEEGWTGWTLYSDQELVDTPFDCQSCHQPFGPGTKKQLLMRQTASPWLHWGDFRGHYANRICDEQIEPHPGPWLPGEGLDVIARLEGANGRHAGVPMDELFASPSGERFSLFLTDAENTIRGAETKPYAYAQMDFDGANVLCERATTGTSPTWDRQRAESLAHGQPMPFYGYDVLDPERRAEVLADRHAFLERHATEDAAELAMSFMDANAAAAIGFVPLQTDSASTILRQACVRCHAANVDRRLKRAGFNAEKLDRFEPTLARSIMRRLSLHQGSPELMPPRRSGELPRWAIARVSEYVREHCADPQPSACD